LLAWRDHRAIPLAAKQMATFLLAISAVVGWLTLAAPWRYVPGGIGVIVLAWMWTRPMI
jgi:uncharacterized membrane protein YbaN (DUF454 family)